jgi:Uroporphyrinogen-III synthase
LDSRNLANKTILSIGPICSKALQQFGIKPDIEAKQSSQKGLAEILPTQIADEHICYPTSSQASTEFETVCKQKNISVSRLNLYETTPCPPTISSLNKNDIVIFSSPSTVNAFLEFFSAFKSIITPIAIGPSTEAHLKTHSFTTILTADSPSIESIINAIINKKKP